MENTYDSNYFANIMNEANAQGVDAGIMEEAKEAMSSAKKNYLKALMDSTPQTFYQNLVNAFGSGILNARTLEKKQASIATKNKVVGEMQNKPTPAFITWMFKAMKAVAAFLLGVAKFAWDVTLITGSFTGRLAWRLVKNTAKAVAATAVETKDDVIFAGKAVGNSFKENILSTMPDPAGDVTVETVEEVEEVPVVEAEIVVPEEDDAVVPVETIDAAVEITEEEEGHAK